MQFSCLEKIKQFSGALKLTETNDTLRYVHHWYVHRDGGKCSRINRSLWRHHRMMGSCSQFTLHETPPKYGWGGQKREREREWERVGLRWGKSKPSIRKLKILVFADLWPPLLPNSRINDLVLWEPVFEFISWCPKLEICCSQFF